MARKRVPKRPKSCGDVIDDNYEEKLIRQRQTLQKQQGMSRARATKEMGDAGFWGIVGGIALAADWTLFGGFGTGVALLSTGLWANCRMDGCPENSFKNSCASSEIISHCVTFILAIRRYSLLNDSSSKIGWLYPSGREAYIPKKSKKSACAFLSCRYEP